MTGIPRSRGARLKLAPASSGRGGASVPAGSSPPWASLNSDRRDLPADLLVARPALQRLERLHRGGVADAAQNVGDRERLSRLGAEPPYQRLHHGRVRRFRLQALAPERFQAASNGLLSRAFCLAIVLLLPYEGGFSNEHAVVRRRGTHPGRPPTGPPSRLPRCGAHRQVLTCPALPANSDGSGEPEAAPRQVSFFPLETGPSGCDSGFAVRPTAVERSNVDAAAQSFNEHFRRQT